MQTRRTFLKATAAASVASVAAAAGLLTPRAVMAAWPEAAFAAKDMGTATKEIFGADAAESADVTVKAPDIAENGAVVPVTVTGKAGDQVAIMVEGNPVPLVASFKLDGANPMVSTRIKMGKTSNVFGMVKNGDAVQMAKKEVKVTIGGCGG